MFELFLFQGGYQVQFIISLRKCLERNLINFGGLAFLDVLDQLLLVI